MFERDLLLPEKDRQVFKEPLGTELYDDDLGSFHAQTTLITVGDVVSLTFRRHGIRPFLSIYDGITERREMTEFATLVEDEEKDEVVNPAGRITRELVESIRGRIEGTGGLIKVIGEEDLALMPAVLLAPIGTDIVYGWPGRCMMRITTDEGIRSKMEHLVSKMEEAE
ncbi:MAG: DUF359 domain-containing protein [Candidatus Methanomethylophilaceae archaeon]|nr:DUF359 domain-containing protein [Candidatus Methanomethylophilaceae archaeon]MBQ9689702.1 DUF359 domain-containing protein [Candidatus Methanomethylophilaceae archaeon]